MSARNQITVTPDEVLSLAKLRDDLKQKRGGMDSALSIGNISLALLHVRNVERVAQELAAKLEGWPESVGTWRTTEKCPHCGREEARVFNVFVIDAPAFYFCEWCGHDWPAPKQGWAGSPPNPGVYAIGDGGGGVPMLVIAAENAPDAAARFQEIKSASLCLNRETPEDWQFWAKWADHQPGQPGKPRDIQMRRVRDLADGETLGQILEPSGVVLPLAHGWIVIEDDDTDEDGE